MIIHVETLEDKRLETYVGLTEIQLRNRLEPEKGIFIAESEKVIVRALDAGYEPLSLLIPEHRLQRSARLVERIETQYALEEKAGAGGSTNDESIPIFVAPSDEIEKLTGFELTRGVLCAMKRKPLPSLADLLADAYRVAVLEDITNHTNVGAVFRKRLRLALMRSSSRRAVATRSIAARSAFPWEQSFKFRGHAFPARWKTGANRV